MQMKQLLFGNTGLKVSPLGFGCMRLPVLDQDNTRIDEERALEMVHYAIDHGVNYFDTAYPYHGADFSEGGSSEPFLAKALRNGYRDKVLIATKLPSWLVESKEDMERFLDEQLERLETGTVDLYLLHSLDRVTWKKLRELGVLDFLDGALESGKIRFAGFSYHDELELFKEIVDAYDWSFCQIQYNYMDEEYQAGTAGLEYAAEKGLAVVVMEPLRGGTLVKGLPREARKALREADPDRTEVDWALHWVWKHPLVTMVLSGMSHLDHVKENLRLAESLPQKEWTAGDERTIKLVSSMIRGKKRVDCTDCSYCMPCPEGVNIPRNFAFYNDHHMLNDPAAKLRYQRIMSETAKASNCIRCGQCEPLCPQGIQIMDQLALVDDTLSK
jgi:predicted aldo/keto reductase-like oxidoreductase